MMWLMLNIVTGMSVEPLHCIKFKKRSVVLWDSVMLNDTICSQKRFGQEIMDI